jgi:hypothetical protein
MITGFVHGQVLRLSAPVVAADTLDYLTAQFVFRSADWSGMEKWAHFSKGGTVYDVRLTDDKIRREDHLNLGAGEWKVYVHGNRFADGTVVERITTAEDVLRVVPTGALDGEPFPEMPASVTEQILARLENVEQNGGGGGGQQAQIDDTLTKPGYAADAAKVGEKFDQLSGEIADIDTKATEKYTAYVSSGSFISKNDGKIYSGTSYGTTGFIPVDGGETVKINGFHCPNGTNASVCAYDSDFAFVAAIITNETDAGDGRIVSLDNNVAYIRSTSTNTGSVVVDYIDKPVASRTTEEPPYNLGTLTSNCYVNKSNGEILSNTSYYGVTDFVEVTARYLKIENPNLSGNGGICEYDANKNFISCLLFPEIKGGQYVVKLSENAKYVRATIVNNNANWLRLYPVSTVDEDSETSYVLDSWLVATGNQIKTPHRKINALSPTITFIDDDTMRYDAVKRYHDIFAKFGKSKNLYNKSAITDGYTIHSQSGANYATDGYSVSDYIPVDGNAQYTFSRKGTIAPYWLLTKIAFYDIEKNFISIAPTQDSPFITPADTAYLRFSTSTARMEGDETDGYIQLEKGSTATAYEKYSEGSHRIKGCYGVITDYLDNDESLKNLLLSYEEEGFGMLFHAKWQDAYYMDDENRDIVLAEADYCQGMRKMQNIGFIDYNYWVSPYGVTDDEITSMCKRHGAKCLLSTSNNTFIQSNGLDGNAQSVKRYALPRCSLGYNDSQYPAFTLADLKAQIDKCVQTNGWLIVTTHVQQWTDEYGTTPDDRLREIIQYALDKGCKIKTFAEAYTERNSILVINDIC